MRVATANAASGRDVTGRPAFERWGQAAAGLDVDVLAVQEVDHLLERSGRTDQVAALARAMGEGWQGRFAAAVHGTPGSLETMRPATGTLADEPSYGVGLLSRHPVREWRELRMAPSRVHLPFPLPPGAGKRVLWVPDEQRVALAAVVDAPEGPVTVVCTHLSFSPPRATGQLRELVAWASDLPRPLVLLGDLNLPGWWPERVSGWRSAGAAPTFPAAHPRVQLDHVLLDGDLTSEGAEAVRVAGDHLALRAVLRRTGLGSPDGG